MHVHHITYATGRFRHAARGLGLSAARFGLCTRVYTPWSMPSLSLWWKYPSIMRNRRGAGYWLWKPHIILDTLESVPDGDVVFYTDAAVTFIADPAPLIRLAQEHRILLFEHGRLPDDPPSHPMGTWTKRDCFVLLDADEPRYWKAPQLVGAFQLYEASEATRHFVRQWAEACCDARILTDIPNTCGLPNLTGFREHRHDQAVLSILAVRTGIRPYQDPSQWGVRSDGDPFGQIFDLHRRRSPTFLQATKRSIKRHLLKLGRRP